MSIVEFVEKQVIYCHIIFYIFVLTNSENLLNFATLKC